MDQLGLLLDVAIAALLVATIVYATVLNRKLAVLRDNKQEMEAMVNRLVESTRQAERGLADLKAAAGDEGETLERRLKEARALADDLSFLVDKGGGLADRLERQLGQARGGASKPAEAPAPAAPARKREEAWPGSTAVNGGPAAGGGGPATGGGSPARGPTRRRGGPTATEPTREAGAPAPRAGSNAAPDEGGPGAGGQKNAKLLKALRGVR